MNKPFKIFYTGSITCSQDFIFFKVDHEDNSKRQAILLTYFKAAEGGQ